MNYCAETEYTVSALYLTSKNFPLLAERALPEIGIGRNECMSNFSSYLDFSLELSDIDGQNYGVVVRSDAGEVREVTTFPFTAGELEKQLLKLENAILRSTDSHRAAQPGYDEAALSFGRALFDFLMPGEARSLYHECLREATHRHRGVRLKLSVHTPRLAALPWEFLYDPRKRDYLCLNPHTPLVRYTELPQTVPPLEIEMPLRILGLVADPVDMPTRLDVESEQRRVSEAVRSLEERGQVELVWMEGHTWRDLQRVMRSATGSWHILHFIGHGGFDEMRNEGFIVLNNDDGTAHRLYASQLARLLARQRSSLRMVLLNACDGARAGVNDMLSSTAATLINSGIPAVLAMQYEITNDGAVEFANAFYEALADNLPVDAAVAEARNAINLSNARSLEWGVPVLHMRASDGRLFALHEDGTPTKVPQPVPSVASTLQVGHRAPSFHTTRPADMVDQVDEYVTASATERLKSYVPPRALPSAVETLDDLRLDVITEVSERLYVVADSFDDLLSAHQQSDRELDDDDDPDEIEAQHEEKPVPRQLPDVPASRPAIHSAPVLSEPALTPGMEIDITLLLESYAHRQHTIIGFDWVTIPAGEFLLGSDPTHDLHMFEDELPQLRVYLSAFRLARVPITNAQYKLFINATDYNAPPHWARSEIPAGKENHPVTNVSWHDALAFCDWAGVRLPTEAEWEKAARGVDGRIYPWGDALPDPTRCNFDLAIGMTSPVGEYPAGASPYGVLDVAGNVWEWTSTVWLDTYEDYLKQIENAGRTALRRVLRGGGFRDVEFVRCAARSWDLPNQRYRDLGFRVAAL